MSILFISDLHLDGAWPEISEQFFGFLESEAGKTETLYILGDLFESWIGDDDDDPHKLRICQALRTLTDAGGAGAAGRGSSVSLRRPSPLVSMRLNIRCAPVDRCQRLAWRTTSWLENAQQAQPSAATRSTSCSTSTIRAAVLIPAFEYW